MATEGEIMQPKVWRRDGIWWFQENPQTQPIACEDFTEALERGVHAFEYRLFDQLGFGPADEAEVAHVA